MPTQEEYNVAKLRQRELYCKVEILNYQFNKVGTLIGNVIDNPNFSNTSESGIRRTCNLSIYPTDSSFDLVKGSKIWIDKYVKIYIGIYYPLNDEVVYTNMGIYILCNPTQTYSATSNIITIDGQDLMAKLTGLRGGTLNGLAYQIPAGNNVRNVLIDTIALFGFENYIIEDYPIIVPNDIEISESGTAYDIISAILDILPNWQAYFDVDGVFHFCQIPNGVDEQVMVNDDLWQDVMIEYSKSYNTDNIKNDIIILGKTHDNTVATTVSISGTTITGTASEISTLEDGLTFSFTAPSMTDGVAYTFNVNGYGAKNIRNDDGTIPSKYYSNEYTVLKYDASSNLFVFLGSYQPRAEVKEINPESPFYINGTVGTLRIVLSGSDYDSISSDYLAQQRADFELYQRCRLLDNINITCVPIYWLDTNWLVELTLKNSDGVAETNQYLIKDINTSYGVGDTQTITLMRYYPYYPST